MKIKEQTRKLAAGCSKHLEVIDGTDAEAQNTVLRLWIELTSDRTDEVSSNHRCGQVSNICTARWELTWFEEIFEEYYSAACCQRLASI
ncbi:hypothetical protein [Streptococcus pneumoniae]|uniref:hypothetical protein n=1 Tax=Streptococcus pneumoniae TaxID=1313 RepID=UPI000B5893DB|nr:hypothetical protein [Streptococcus pneumoniae]